MILMKSMNENSQEYADLGEVIKAATHAAGLTRQLLTFSRKEGVNPKTVNINDIILELKSMMGRILGDDIVLATELAKDLFRIDADPVQISQILMNLLANSRDAMPEGGRVVISTENVTLTEQERVLHPEIMTSDFVKCEVRDNGIGMDEETRLHAFEPFFTTKDIGKGTGLGLSTVFGIVRQRGGFITCDSKKNTGTGLCLYFPKSILAETPQKLPEGGQEFSGINGTILVAEDNEGLNKLLVRLLEEQGCRVLTAANGKQALEHCSKGNPGISLVISDIMMPEMGGEELVRKLIRQFPGIKVLFMSGYVDDILKRPDFRNRPGMGLIIKPFTGKEIMKKIQALLSQKG